MIKKLIHAILLILFITNIVYANYYADITINVQEDGRVSIGGKTDYTKFENITYSHIYTSKQGPNWTFNLTTDEIFDSYIFELNLPSYAQINYIKAPPGFRITSSHDNIKIVGFGEKKPINLIVQYTLSEPRKTLTKEEIFFLTFSITLIILIIITITLYLKLKKLNFVKTKPKTLETNNENQEEQGDNIEQKTYDIKKFSPRQQDMINLLEENKHLTQKQIEEMMKIPKSSVSRNIRTLELKGVIEKDRIGQTNYIHIRKKS